MCLSNRPCQTLWVNPASSRNLRLILLVSHSQSVSRLNLRGSHYASFRLGDLLRSQYGILNSYWCQQVCIYVHVNIYVLLGIYPVFAQLLFPMLKFFSRPMKCEVIYVFSPYTLFSHWLYKWPGKQTTMSLHYGNELSRDWCWLLHRSVSKCLICSSVSSQFVWWICRTCRNWPTLISLSWFLRCPWPPLPWSCTNPNVFESYSAFREGLCWFLGSGTLRS